MSSGYSSPVVCARVLFYCTICSAGIYLDSDLILRPLFTGRGLIPLLWEIHRIARCARVVEKDRMSEESNDDA